MNDTPDFSDWIGRSVTETGLASGRAADCLAATLDRDDPAHRDGDALPPAWHYICFHEAVPLSRTGPDGHPATDATTPPFPGDRRMWAGSRMRFESPIRVGERLTKVTTISDISAKEGATGPLHFITTVEDVLGEDGRLTTREERTRVYRGPSGAGSQRRRHGPPAEPRWSRTVEPSAVLLFRYSALTMNSHRIHYDHDYARGVEGHPGLLVHGPLLMTLLLDLLRREMPDAAPTSMDLRALAPVHDTAAFSVHGAPEGDLCHLWAETADGAVGMTARVAIAPPAAG